MDILSNDLIDNFAHGFIGDGDMGIIEAFEINFPDHSFNDLTLSQLERIDSIVMMCSGCGFAKDADDIEEFEGELFCEDCMVDVTENLDEY